MDARPDEVTARRRLGRRILVGVATALLLTLAVGAGLVAHHRGQPKHFEAVTPGVLYRSALLRPEKLADVLDTHGIRTVVSLLPPRPGQLDDEVRVTRSKGVRLVEIPMPVGARPTPAQLDEWLALLDDAGSQPILVHCEHGVVRTGMMVAVYQVEFLGVENEAALQGLPMWRHDRDDPDLGHMRATIREYVPRARRASAGAAG
jgi:protein tyrosine/serine phosphatase